MRVFAFSLFPVLLLGALSISPISLVVAEEVKYQAPASVGAPSRRVGGGGIRGLSGKDGDELLKGIHLAVLAPLSTGHTAQSQPTLYWAISDVIDNPIELVLAEAYPSSFDAPSLLETRLKIGRAGIHAISLKENGITLKPNVEYEFFVTIIRDPTQRSMDIIASGSLMHVMPTAELKTEIDRASAAALAKIYAENGFWYDLIEHISDGLRTSPNNAELRKMRTSLLEQVNLPRIAGMR